MVADAALYSQLRQQAPQEGPLDQFGKMISIKSLIGNEQLNEMQRTKLARDMQEEESFRNLFAGATPEQMGAPDFLRQALSASPTRGLALQKSMLDQQKSKAELGKLELEAQAAKAKDARDTLAGVTDQASYDAWRQYGAGKGYQVAAQAPAVFDAKWQRQHLMTADKFIDQTTSKLQAVGLGGTSKLVEMNPNAPGFDPKVDLRHTATPGEIMSNRAALANLQVKGAEATPGGVFSIPDIVARAGGGGGAPAAPAPTAPAGGMVTPASLLNPPQNAALQATAAPAAPARPAPAAAVPANPISDALSKGLRGEELLKAIPQNVADQVRMMVEGRMAPPTSMALAKPYWQGMMSLATAVDPGWDETVWKTRNTTRSDFASGANGKNLTAINTAIGHLGSLAKAAEALDTSNFPLFNNEVNAVRNFAREKTDPEFIGKVRTFDEAKGAVASELMRVFRGVGASTAETKEWGENIRKSDSPTAMRAAVTGATELLESRIQALSEQYKRGMNTKSDVDVLGMVYPKSRATLDALKAGKVPGGKEDAQNASGKLGGAKPSGIKFLGWVE